MQHPGPNSKHMQPIGGYVLADEPLELNAGRPTIQIEVHNTGDRPIQVGSHFHFFEANRMLEFDRDATFGVAAGYPCHDVDPVRARRQEDGPAGAVRRPAARVRLQWPGERLDRPGSTPGYQPDRAEAVRRAQIRGFKSTSGNSGK